MDEQKICYYDSAKGAVDQKEYMSNILNYLFEERLNRLKSILNMSEWRLDDVPCPIQHNGYDCGVFVCVFMEYLSRGAKFNFTQDHMLSFRHLIARELTIKNLINVNVSTSAIYLFIKSSINSDKQNLKRKK